MTKFRVNIKRHKPMTELLKLETGVQEKKHVESESVPERIGSIKIKRGVWIALLLILLATILGFIAENATIGMAVAVLQIIFIFACAKLSMFSIFPALLTFSLFQEYGAVSGWDVYGLLGLGTVPVYFDELKACVYTLNLIVLAFILFTRCLENERELLRTKLEISAETSAVLLLIAVVITLLIFPSFPNFEAFSSGNRFDAGIISFSGWSAVPFFLLAVAGGNMKHRKATIGVAVFVIVWYAFHGERVEAIGFVVLLVIRYYFNNRGKVGTIIKVAFIATVVVVVFVVIGDVRNGADIPDIESLISSIVIQSTACDATYVFNCAVDLYYGGLQLDGVTYLSYLVNCIPRLQDPYSFAGVIKDYYYTPGGGLFFAEPVANFGFLFSAAVSAMYFAAIFYVLSHRNKYTYLVYCTLIIDIFRSVWYGLNYPITVILYFAPMVLIMNNFLTRSKRNVPVVNIRSQRSH